MPFFKANDWILYEREVSRSGNSFLAQIFVRLQRDGNGKVVPGTAKEHLIWEYFEMSGQGNLNNMDNMAQWVNNARGVWRTLGEASGPGMVQTMILRHIFGVVVANTIDNQCWSRFTLFRFSRGGGDPRTLKECRERWCMEVKRLKLLEADSRAMNAASASASA